MKTLFTILAIVLATISFAQQENQIVEQGNTFYRQQQYDRAEAEYRKALEISPDDQAAKFNLANTLIKQNRSEEAGKILVDLKSYQNKNDVRSKSNYNEGVVFTHQKKLEESIEAYKQALRLNPDDQEARENLQKALLELRKKQPEQKEQKKKEQQQQQQKPKPRISPKDAENQLKSLEQKEKQVQQRLQKNSAKTGVSQPKDW